MELAQNRGLRQAFGISGVEPSDLLSENSFTKYSVVFNRSFIDRFVYALPEHHD
jgi:hypothetical protein